MQVNLHVLGLLAVPGHGMPQEPRKLQCERHTIEVSGPHSALMGRSRMGLINSFVSRENDSLLSSTRFIVKSLINIQSLEIINSLSCTQLPADDSAI